MEEGFKLETTEQRSVTAEKWWRRRPKRPYLIAVLVLAIVVAIAVGVAVLVFLLYGGEKADKLPKTIGGRPVNVSEVPFIVSFGTRNTHACHGSLVESQFVVTTANCITTNTKLLSITMGRTNLDDEGGETRKHVDFKVHPKWDRDDPRKWGFDEAVVKLDRPVENIRPVCLAAEGSVFPTGSNATVYGWGRVGTTEILPEPRTLQAVNVTLSDHDQCKRKYYGKVTDDMLCAGAGDQNICHGDSGAPLVVKVGDVLIQLGSKIIGPSDCGEANMPAVYLIHDTAFIKWAIKEMSPKPTPPPTPPPKPQCGKRNLVPIGHVENGEQSAPDSWPVPIGRIESGQESAPHSWPWMAYVTGRDGRFRSHAVLINESFVATHWETREGYYVVFGAHDLSSTSEPTQRIMIEEVFMHPNRTSLPLSGIRLAKLSHPVNFTSHVAPICLPEADDVLPAGTTCLIAGWGDNSAPSTEWPWVTDRLHEGSVTTITNQQCRDAWEDDDDDDDDDYEFSAAHDEAAKTRFSIQDYITKDTICTTADETRPSFMDRGGPLMCVKDSVWFLHGVQYYPVDPALYWRVPEMVPWINEVMSRLPAPTPDPSNQVCFKKYEGGEKADQVPVSGGTADQVPVSGAGEDTRN